MSDDIARRPMTDEIWNRADHLDLLLDRLDVIGIATRLDSGDALLAAHDRCLECPNPDACERHLANPASCSSHIPRDCPNASFLARCLGVRRRHRD